MKVISYNQYGGTEVLNIKDQPVPEPAKHEVLIKNLYIGLNPSEAITLQGKIWIARLESGILRPKQNILGGDIVGEVVQIGRDVRGIKVGDRVATRTKGQALAEFTALNAQEVCLIPANVDDLDAAASILTGVTAYQALVELALVKPKEKVLINGVTGGIGIMATQLARNTKATVDGFGSSANFGYLKSLGLNKAHDYLFTSLEELNETYDIIIDLVGNWSAKSILKQLKPNGCAVMVGYQSLSRTMGWLLRKGKRAEGKQMHILNAEANPERLKVILQLIADKKVKPRIGEVFPLEKSPEAFEVLCAPYQYGKLILRT